MSCPPCSISNSGTKNKIQIKNIYDVIDQALQTNKQKLDSSNLYCFCFLKVYCTSFFSVLPPGSSSLQFVKILQ